MVCLSQQGTQLARVMGNNSENVTRDPRQGVVQALDISAYSQVVSTQPPEEEPTHTN
jgi:hypothetical protein